MVGDRPRQQEPRGFGVEASLLWPSLFSHPVDPFFTLSTGHFSPGLPELALERSPQNPQSSMIQMEKLRQNTGRSCPGDRSDLFFLISLHPGSSEHPQRANSVLPPCPMFSTTPHAQSTPLLVSA